MVVVVVVVHHHHHHHHRHHQVAGRGQVGKAVYAQEGLGKGFRLRWRERSAGRGRGGIEAVEKLHWCEACNNTFFPGVHRDVGV